MLQGALGQGQRASTVGHLNLHRLRDDLAQQAFLQGLTTFNSFWNYVTPLFGGYVADARYGRFNTIVCVPSCQASLAAAHTPAAGWHLHRYYRSRPSHHFSTATGP